MYKELLTPMVYLNANGAKNGQKGFVFEYERYDRVLDVCPSYYKWHKAMWILT